MTTEKSWPEKIKDPQNGVILLLSMAGHGKEKIRKGTAAANLQNEVLLAVFGSEALSVLIFQGAELLAGWCRGERLETSQLGIFFVFLSTDPSRHRTQK